MKILYWTELFWPSIGGVEVLSAELVTAFERRGHTIEVVTSNVSPELAAEDVWRGVAIHRFHFRRALTQRDPGLIKEVAAGVTALKARLSPDVIHLNTTDPGVFFHFMTRKASPAPTVLTMHAFSSVGRGPESLEVHALESSDWVIGVSESMLADARGLVPAIAECSSLIYPALPTPDEAPRAGAAHPPRLVCAGRMLPVKGFDVAVRAFARIAPKCRDACLVLAGDGASRCELEALAAELDVGHRVDFPGWTAPDRIPELIRQSSAVVVPSRWKEPFGLIAAQAGQQGRPVIASRTGGLAEIVVHGQTGLLVEPDRDVELSEAMLWMLEHPEEAARMGERGRDRVTAAFGWSHCVNQHEAIYRRVADRSRP